MVTDDHDYCIDSSALSTKTTESINNTEISVQSSSGSEDIESLGIQVENNRKTSSAIITSNSKSIIPGMLISNKNKYAPFCLYNFTL